jgi:hypothetical protein
MTASSSFYTKFLKQLLKPIPHDIEIVAYAYDEKGNKAITIPIGKMIVRANDEKHRKTMKIALTRVFTNVTQDNKTEEGVFTSNELVSLFNTLHQSLILPEVVNTVRRKGVDEDIILNLENDKKFLNGTPGAGYGEYLSAGVINPDDGKGFAAYLETRLDRIYPECKLSRDYFLAFCFWENGLTDLLGRASAKVAAGKLVFRSSVSIFPARDDPTLPHELLHALQLFHTHKGASISARLQMAQRYIFPLASTTNVMSYNPDSCYSLWKWQWDIMQENAERIIR